MRILDDGNDNAIKSVLILLNKLEAKELIDALHDLLSCDEQQFHVHINDAEYQREITLALYDDIDIKKNTFDKRVMELIWEDK